MSIGSFKKNVAIYTGIFWLLLACTSMSWAQPIDTLLARADALEGADQFDEAERLLDRADSLIRLERLTDKAWRVQVIRGNIYLAQQQYPTAIEHFSSLLTTSEPKQKDDALILAKALNDLGIALYETGQIEEARDAHLTSLEIYQHWEDPQGLAYNYGNLANIAREAQQHEEAIRLYELAKLAAESVKDYEGVGIMFINMGLVYFGQDKYAQGIDFLYQAQDLFREHQDTSRLMTTNRLLGNMYIRLLDYESAMPLVRESMAYYKTQNSPRNLARNYRTLAELNSKLQRYDSARYYYLEATQLFKSIENVSGLIDSYFGMGLSYRQEGNFDSARWWFAKTRILAEDGHPRDIASLNEQEGIMLFEEGKYQEAIASMELAQQADAEINHGTRPKLDEVLYQAYKILGNRQKALYHLERKDSALDAFYSKQNNLDIARLEVRSQVERERALQRAEQENTRLRYEQQLTRQRWVIFTSLAGTLLLGWFLFYLRKRNLQIKAANLALSEKNETIAQQNEELIAINEQLKAAHDRETELLQENLSAKERELASVALVNHEKNEMLNTITQKLSELKAKVEGESLQELNSLKKTISSHVNLNASWDSFFHHFQDVHPHFYEGLKRNNPNLTNNDLKLSSYLKIGMSNKEIASMSNLEVDSVKRSINRLKNKLQLGPEDNVRSFMMSYTGA